jgi:hypothetical protein
MGRFTRFTRFAYDCLSRLVAVVLPNPATGANPPLVDGSSPEPGALVTRYAYDEQGNKISQTEGSPGSDLVLQYQPASYELRA